MKFIIAAGILLAAIWVQDASAGAPPMSGLSLWLKADKGLAMDGSSWADQSGQGHNATAIAGEAPAYAANAIKGLPAAHFSGAQAMTISGSLLTSQQFTIIALVTDTGLNEGLGLRRDILSNWSSSTGPQSVYLGTISSQVSGSNKTALDRIRFTDAIGGSTDKGNPEGGEGKIGKPTVPFQLGGISTSSNASIFVNGKVVYSLSTPLPARDETMAWFIGQQGAANVEFFIGDIAEILVYNRSL